MLMVVSSFVFTTTILWYFMVVQAHAYEQETEDYFIAAFKLNEKSYSETFVLCCYWSFTTLTTVGFGDIVPKTDLERFFCSMVLLFGVALFSYV